MKLNNRLQKNIHTIIVGLLINIFCLPFYADCELNNNFRSEIDMFDEVIPLEWNGDSLIELLPIIRNLDTAECSTCSTQELHELCQLIDQGSLLVDKLLLKRAIASAYSVLENSYEDGSLQIQDIVDSLNRYSFAFFAQEIPVVLNRSRAPRPPEEAGVEFDTPDDDSGAPVCCPLPRDVNIDRNLFVGGNLTVEGNVYFNGGSPGICINTLYVKQGVLSGPNEFNSIKDAVDSIVGSSLTNRFVVKICPGLYIEDTITLKPWVAITGDAPGVVTIQVDSPSKDVIIGAPNAILQNVQIEGATDTGKSGVVFSGGSGGFLVRNCLFGSNDIQIYHTATVAPLSSLVVDSCIFVGASTFTTGIKQASGAFAGILEVFNLSYLRSANPGLDALFDITGPLTTLIVQACDAGSLTPLTGTGLRITDGSVLNMKGSTLRGFASAINIPNVGAGPRLAIQGILINDCTEDLRIDNPLATGVVDGAYGYSKTVVNSASPVALFIKNNVADYGFVSVGSQYGGDNFAQVTNISRQIQDGSTLGVIEGGTLSDGGGLNIDATEGSGYLQVGTHPTDYLKFVEWSAQSIAVLPNEDNFLYIDENGTLQTTLSQPNLLATIVLGKAHTAATGVVFIQEIPAQADHTTTRISNTLRGGFGNIYDSGSIVTKNGTVQLDVTSGRYYFDTQEFDPTGGIAITWNAFYRNGGGGSTVTSQSSIDYDHYDDGSGILASIPVNEFARHALYVVGDGIQETYLLVYAQTTYPTLVDAQNGDLPPEPGTWTGNIALISSIIVKNTAVVADRITEIRDERPRIGFKASGVTVVTNHGDLTGLLDDDHPQYMLVNGMRSMSGTLDMGTNNIINVGLLDGVDVPAHASRHLPNGADPLTTAVPLTISTSNSIGIANSFSRSDHVHAHGSQTDETLHAIATAATAGFMSAADKSKIDNDFVLKAGDTMTGDLAFADQKEVRLQESTINGANYAALKAPPALPASYVLTLPVDDGISGQVLSTNGSGELSWVSEGSGDIIDGGQPGPLIIGTDDATSLSLVTNSGSRLVISSGGTVTIPNLTPSGIVHSVVGLLTSSLIVNADVDPAAGIVDTKLATISTAGKVLNSATTATSANTANAIVARDVSGDFSAGTITANLTGSASNNVLKAGDTMTGALIMDNQQQIRFREATINGTNFAAIQAPASLAADYTLTLPVDDGTSGQVLSTDGTGVLSWVASGGGDIVNGGQSGPITIGTNDATALNLRTNGTNRLSIDSSGNTTYTSNYKANVRVGTNQLIHNAGTQTIQFDTVTYDPNSNFNTGTFLYTAPVTGYYFVSINLTTTYSNDNIRTLNLLKNGSPVTGYSSQTSRRTANSLSTIIDLTAGDTLGAQLVNTNGDATMLANHTSMVIHFMSL